MNRKRPVRDEWNSFGLQSEQCIDSAAVEDEDICIKVSYDEPEGLLEYGSAFMKHLISVIFFFPSKCLHIELYLNSQ